MKYIIVKEDKTPAYMQLYKQLKEDIVKEIYPYNSKLPSKRTIAREIGISVITVEHAYALLCDEGYVEPRQRSGYFVIFKETDGFAISENKSSIPLNAANNHSSSDFYQFPLSVLTKTMRKVINDFGGSILEKSPNSGCIELRSSISRYLAANRGIYAEVEQIIIGSGSEYLYGLIVELLGRNKIYAIEAPSYKKIEQVYKACEIIYKTLPLCQDGIESAALWNSNADILHITPYRSFPSGVSASASKRHEYLRWAFEGSRYIVEDDFESEFSISKKTEETLFSNSTKDNVIYMNTFSKTISPSLRVGYMVLPKRLVSEFDKKLGFYSCAVSSYIQYVLAELISNGDFQRHINRVRRLKRKENIIKK